MKYSPGYAPYLLGNPSRDKPRLVFMRGRWHSFLGGTDDQQSGALDFLERVNGEKYHATRLLREYANVRNNPHNQTP